MRAPCGNCGAYVELGTALREGREVLCPSCGAVIVPGRPSDRAEIPGLGRTEKVVPQAARAPVPPPEPAPAIARASVRASVRAAEEIPDETAGRTIEARLKEQDALKRRRARRDTTKKVLDILVLFGLLAAVLFGAKTYLDYRQRAREQEAGEKAAESQRALERERLKAEERAHTEERLAAERDALRKAKAREVEAREAKAAEERTTAETYKTFLYALRENEFDMFSAAVTGDWATVETELCYLLPVEGRDMKLYWVATRPDEAARVFRIDSSGGRDEIELPLFLKRLAGLDYLVAREGKVYYHASRSKPLTGKLDAQKPTDPAPVFFGGLAKTVATLAPAYDELSFDIVFVPKGSDKRIFCENVPFGCVPSATAVRQALVQAYPPPSGAALMAGAEPFKRTVKFWNGSHIKTAPDGITYIPRKPPSQRSSSRGSLLTDVKSLSSSRSLASQDDASRWKSLQARALQEDASERAHNERELRRRETAAERAWREKLDKILREGQLYYRARKAKSR